MYVLMPQKRMGFWYGAGGLSLNASAVPLITRKRWRLLVSRHLHKNQWVLAFVPFKNITVGSVLIFPETSI
jgi:hypothetical protein